MLGFIDAPEWVGKALIAILLARQHLGPTLTGI